MTALVRCGVRGYAMAVHFPQAFAAFVCSFGVGLLGNKASGAAVPEDR